MVLHIRIVFFIDFELHSSLGIAFFHVLMYMFIRVVLTHSSDQKTQYCNPSYLTRVSLIFLLKFWLGLIREFMIWISVVGHAFRFYYSYYIALLVLLSFHSFVICEAIKGFRKYVLWFLYEELRVQWIESMCFTT